MKDFVCFVDSDGKVKENFLSDYCGKSKNVVIPSQFEILEMSCFDGNSQIESVEIPESVLMIKAFAFQDCSNLNTVKIPGNLYSVSPKAFGDVQTTARILMTNPNYIEKDGFIINSSNNSLLFGLDNTKESLSVPDGIKYIGLEAFAGFENLKEISIPDSVICFEMMSFFFCRHLEKINFPKNLKKIAAAAFVKCDKLQEISISENTEIAEFGNEILLKK